LRIPSLTPSHTLSPVQAVYFVLLDDLLERFNWDGQRTGSDHHLSVTSVPTTRAKSGILPWAESAYSAG
jgi:hypothetical protein